MAAISSSSLSTVAIPVCSSSSISSRPQVSFLRSNPSTFMAAKQRLSSSRIVSVPQVSDSTAVVASAEDEAPSSSTFVAGADSEKVEFSFEETRGRISKVFDKNKINRNEASISTYDTAWIAMVPYPFSSSEPCFPDSVFWLLQNQCDDGSWARPHHLHSHSHSLLNKDVLSSTLACILALHKWGVGQEQIQKGLQFIEKNIGWASDETQITPMGFNIVFPALLDYATDSSLNLRLDPSTLNHLLQQRDSELQRCKESGDEAYLAYIAEAMGKSHNWESSLIKYQRKNGSLFNSPSTTAAAYIALPNSDCLNYLNLVFTKSGNAAVPAVYPLNIYYQLCIVDNLQSLGISRHFSREIQTVLNQTYKCWVQGDEEIFMDTITCALAFRILRLNGYDVTSEAITKIVSSSFPGNGSDINTALELYKASELTLYPEETDLDKQNLRLKSLLEKGIQSSQLNAQVKQALEYPFYAILERMATRKNIENYNFDNPGILKTSYCWPNFSHKGLVSLAVEDYNRCQVIHQEELREYERWFVESRLNELGLLSQKYTYCYFTAAATMFAPELADARISWAKNAIMISVTDDLFDVNGSLEEVTNLIHLLEKWDVDVSTECSSLKVEIIFSALKGIICETEEIGSKVQGRSIKDHITAIWLECLYAYMKEVEWRLSKFVPTFDEYLSNAYVSFGLGPIVLLPLYLVGPKISPEMSNHCEYHELFKMMSICGRLQNDIRGFEREVEEGKLNTLSVYMINNEITSEATLLEMQSWILTQRRELHKLVLEEDSVIPKPCKELFWHMNSVTDLFYYKDDGFWLPDLVQVANHIIHQPIILKSQPHQHLI